MTPTLTFEAYWITRVEPHWDKAFADALSQLIEAWKFGKADAREKAAKGWVEHDGVIENWSWLECEQAGYEECLDLLVYHSTARYDYEAKEAN